MDEDRLVEILDAQEAAVDGLPKAVKAMLRNVDKLSDAERALLKDILG
jgi:ABC-type transporter Mla subunit MlaD